MSTSPVRTKRVQKTIPPGELHIQEVRTRVFYNSKYSGNKECHLVTTSKLGFKPHKTDQNTRKGTGITKNVKPLVKNQHTDIACTGNTNNTYHGDQGSADRQGEVSAPSPQQTIMKSTKSVAGNALQGYMNVVAPDTGNNTCQTEVSNSLCHSKSHIPVSENHA